MIIIFTKKQEERLVNRFIESANERSIRSKSIGLNSKSRDVIVSKVLDILNPIMKKTMLENNITMAKRFINFDRTIGIMVALGLLIQIIKE